MKFTLLTLTTLALLSASSCDILDDLEFSDLELEVGDIKYEFDSDLQISEDENENELDLTDLKDSSGIERSIFTDVITNLLRNFLSTLTSLNIASINLGPEIGSLSDITVYINGSYVYQIESGKGNNIKNLTITIENVTLTGEYDIKSLQLPGPIELFGKGSVNIHLEYITFTTGVDLKLVVSCLQITGFPDFYLAIQKSTINFGNLMGGGAVGELLNKIISDALPKLIEAVLPVLIPLLEPALATALNPYINCLKNHAQKPDVCFQQTPDECGKLPPSTTAPF